MVDQSYLYRYVTKGQHEHLLVFVQEFTGDHRLYWCRECGLLIEFFSTMTAHMVPEWSLERLGLSTDDRKELGPYKFVKETVHKTTNENRLGKGLKDIQTPYPAKLAELLGMK